MRGQYILERGMEAAKIQKLALWEKLASAMASMSTSLNIIIISSR
jgi:hypothetical protein